MALLFAIVGSCMIGSQTDWIIGLGVFLVSDAIGAKEK
jgi:hypothetical protein